jgi:RHS repeat-associated protein
MYSCAHTRILSTRTLNPINLLLLACLILLQYQRSRFQNAPANSICKILVCAFLMLGVLAAVSTVQAQSCPNDPHPGGESISASISNSASSASISGNTLVPVGTQIRIDASATASGGCTGKAWHCPPGEDCTCEPTGYEYERTVNHINVWADVSTNTSLNGTYNVGVIANSSGFDHSVNSSSANSSGPIYMSLSIPGTYSFHFQATINPTPCMLEPFETGVVTITIQVGDGGTDMGEQPCENTVGEPIDVTSGNMFLHQEDYYLPGFGDGLRISRGYNSQMQKAGLFGFGWWSFLDESITTFGNLLLRLNLEDGRAIYLSRSDTNSPYLPTGARGFRGQVVKNVDNSFTLTLQNGDIHQFNANGRLVSLTDRNNNTTTLTLNGSGNPTAITDPGGRVITLSYDSYGLIGSISDSAGTIATYTHGFWGRLTNVTYADGSMYNFTDTFSGSNIYLATVTDALNNVLESHTYDSQGRAITSEIAGNGTERYTLSYVSSTETDVTDALNRLTKYFFNSNIGTGLVTSIEGSCGCGGGSAIQSLSYDTQGNVTSKTDALNHATSYTYDSNGNRLTETNALGTTTYTYNSFGQVLTGTDPMGGVWTNTYDSHGNLLTAKDALNNTTTLTYDSHGQLLTISDPRNNATTLTYDTNGNLTQVTDALNHQTSLAYDSRGRVTSVTNALNQVTAYDYDVVGRLKKITYPDTNTVVFTYDLAGRRAKIKDPRGYETTVAYDAAYRVTSETNAANNVTSYAYDVMSNVTGITDAPNRTTNISYDNFNRPTKIRYPEASAGAGRLEENYAYDLVGNVVSKTDQAGRVTTFCYDTANRLTSTIDPAQKTTSYEYNARSQMTALVDAISQRYEFVYDAVGRTTQNKRGTATMSFVYDTAGNRSQRTDYNGAITNYTYDALNRLTTISYPDTTSATYGYDVLSRLTTATNPTGTVTIGYDNRSRVSSVTDVFGQVVGYQYDANSNRTQLSLNSNLNATYQYDAINRLTQLTDNASLNTTFAYDATNKLTSRTLPNGVVSTYEYDGLDRLTRLKHAKGSNTLADFQYQLSVVNNITQMIDGAGTHSYTYDSLDRLTGATHPTGQTNESYSYDDVGNRTASHQGSSYSYQAFNRLVSANGTTFGYDTNGNEIAKTDSAGGWSYAWDYENRLKEATLAGGVTVTYSYDALGRRIQRTSGASGTTKYIYDGIDVLRDLDGAGATVTEYLNGLGIDNKLRQTAGGNTSYFLTDHLATTRANTDPTGAITSSASYDSYGDVASGFASTRYTYTGREFDAETGLVYYRARWYEPAQGRFTAEDPLGLRGGINLFGYVANNPTRFRDPTGLCAAEDRPKNPCGAILPSDENQMAAVVTIMHETSVGTLARAVIAGLDWSIGGNLTVAYEDRAWLARAIVGVVIDDELQAFTDTIAIASSEQNKSWAALIHSSYTSAKNRTPTQMWNIGLSNIDRALKSAAGSDECEFLKKVIDAVSRAATQGPKDKRFNRWYGAGGVLPKKALPTVRKVGDTTFYNCPPGSGC